MEREQECIEALFEPLDRDVAFSMLSELPGNTKQDPKRIRLAAIRYSGGSLERLEDAIKLCKRDFRDLLMNAGFGEVDAHLQWCPRKFEQTDIENWLDGKKLDGVDFEPNEDVWKLTVVLRRKKAAKILALDRVEPNVVYLVRYSSGREELVAQSHLVKKCAG